MELLSYLDLLVRLYRPGRPGGGRPGQGLVEYALIVTLIGIAVIAALTVLGANVTNVFARISSSLSGVPGVMP
jgi:pilus assembly protein Flp/PilA